MSPDKPEDLKIEYLPPATEEEIEFWFTPEAWVEEPGQEGARSAPDAEPGAAADGGA